MTHTPAGATCVDDLEGYHYHVVMKALHDTLRPRTYLEVGSLHGDTLVLSRCPAVAVDPQFDFSKPELFARIMDRPELHFYQMPSDTFFARHRPTEILGAPVDFAFLDGMHRCEFLLRDFINTERFCRPNSIIALHDCVPVEAGMTARQPSPEPAIRPHRQGWWTGDVWRTALLLKRVRPDLSMTVLDAHTTGLILVTNLDPGSTVLPSGYAAHVRTMLGWTLPEIGIPALHRELNVERVEDVLAEEQLTARFWL
jgi:hypothetical protein